MLYCTMKKAPDSKVAGKGHKTGSPKPVGKSASRRSTSAVKKSDPVKSLASNALAGSRSNIPNTATVTAGVPTTNPTSTIIEIKDARLPTEADIRRISNSPNSSPEFKIIAEPPFSDVNCITDNIYLTGICGRTKENFEKLRMISKSAAAKNSKLVPSLIVNATKEAPNLIDYDCLRVSVDDDRSEDIYPHLKTAVDRMYQVFSQGGKVIVHCTAGVSRSAAVAIAYLIRHRKMTLRRAYTSVAKARPVSRPNSTFLIQLIKFERDTMGTSSTRIIRVRKNGIIVELPDFLFFDLPQKFEEEFNSNRAMNRVLDCGTDEVHNEYPLYDLDRGDKIPPPGTALHPPSSGVRATKSDESLGGSLEGNRQNQQH